ncbi:FAD-dependent oxidoreductase [Pseudomarimonas arenosa]|uniref:FAD-dependent oxidoreductase n=1 Tax=Pseudomarimonas arenosa TaxID=2774145 RepID=A0AAW3ZHU1_9GAMM|nr:FAD-dependent oxidoreductase [Pseudomarimonas arenosa]MBD8524272.1 FAD-dependent oxidoreductase [Pseudomarimonas arenosa]
MINGLRYSAAISAQTFDYVVIGSGLGGLTTAALLAKAGKRVLVLERHYTAGGFTHSFRRRGYEWDVGVHYIGDVHKPHSPMRRVFDAITDGALAWAKMEDVYDSMIIAGDRYDYHSGVRQFREGLLRHFPRAGADIDAYLKQVRRASQAVLPQFGPRLLPGLLQGAALAAGRRLSGDYFARSTFDVLRECTRDRKLASVLAGQWGDYGTPPKQSGFAMHALVAQHYLDGANFPVGGASQIAYHIIPTIEAAGGAVLVDAEVERLLIDRSRVVGVRMVNGDEIRCAHVISAAGVHTTFAKLVPTEISEQHGLLSKLEALPRSVSHLGLYVGLKGSRQDLQLEQSNLWVYRGYDHDAELKRFLAEPNTDFPLKYISFPSAKDPAWDEHYPGKSTIDVIAPAPWQWFQRWQNTPWGQRGQAYDDYKQELTEALLEEVYTQVPQTRGKVDYAELSTPLSTAHFSNYTAGELYGLEHSPQRFATRWLSPRTPIKGLSLTGQDILFCGVGSALMSGVLTAASLIGPRLLRIVPDLLGGRSVSRGQRLKRWLSRSVPAQPMEAVVAARQRSHSSWWQARCIGVETLGSDSKAFRFACDRIDMRHFRPGQFVTLRTQNDGRSTCRSYTVSSCAQDTGEFELAVKRVAEGPFSNWLCDALKPGDLLEMSGPFGDFSCVPATSQFGPTPRAEMGLRRERKDTASGVQARPRKLLLLSAGSGITPMLSMARWLSETGSATDVIFLHTARRQSELMFNSELERLAKHNPRFHLSISLSQEPPRSRWRGYRGRLNADMLAASVPDLAEREVFLCGPQGFMDSARALFSAAGLPDAQLHVESFDVSPSLNGKGGEVQFETSGQTLISNGEQSLLELAESAGIAIASACRTGHCGECKLRCIEGEVSMSETGGLSAEEIDQGYVLACVAAANGKVKLAA